ncbi:MAG: NosD domain-containing protein, partial [Promethearchaeota archaeon]
LNNNFGGLYLEYSNFSKVHNNTLNENFAAGIYLYYSNSSTVTNNSCDQNSLLGISVFTGLDNIISWNSLVKNGFYGISISSTSNNNSIHHNTFINNGETFSLEIQAKDDGINNYWDDTSNNEGNYWSDYNGTGSYPIDGDAGAVDPYPLNQPTITEFNSNLILISTLILGLFGLIVYLRRLCP